MLDLALRGVKVESRTIEDLTAQLPFNEAQHRPERPWPFGSPDEFSCF